MDRVYFRIKNNRLAIVNSAGKDIGHVAGGVGGIGRAGKALGYGIDKEYRGLGIMPKAVKAFIEHTEYTIFQAVTLPDNEASKRVLIKCGFVHVNADETAKNPKAYWEFQYFKAEVLRVAA